jgi:phosphate transport system substrate-binding protein
MKQALKLICRLALAFSFAFAGNAGAQAPALSIPGSGDWEAVLKQLADAYVRVNPGQSIEVPAGSGSSAGIRSVLSNTTIMARVARQPKAEQLRAGIKWHPVARDAVVFAVGERVELKALGGTELAAVFAGRVKDWRELGGKPAPIRVLVRESTDSVHQIIFGRLDPFRNLVLTDHAKMVSKTAEMVEMLGRYRTSIGFITQSALTLTDSGAQAVALDGVAPTAENLASGKYPLSIDYAFVYRPERLDRAARDFLAFVGSDAGRTIILRAGLAPL